MSFFDGLREPSSNSSARRLPNTSHANFRRKNNIQAASELRRRQLQQQQQQHHGETKHRRQEQQQQQQNEASASASVGAFVNDAGNDFLSSNNDDPFTPVLTDTFGALGRPTTNGRPIRLSGVGGPLGSSAHFNSAAATRVQRSRRGGFGGRGGGKKISFFAPASSSVQPLTLARNEQQQKGRRAVATTTTQERREQTDIQHDRSGAAQQQQQQNEAQELGQHNASSSSSSSAPFRAFANDRGNDDFFSDNSCSTPTMLTTDTLGSLLCRPTNRGRRPSLFGLSSQLNAAAATGGQQRSRIGFGRCFFPIDGRMTRGSSSSVQPLTLARKEPQKRRQTSTSHQQEQQEERRAAQQQQKQQQHNKLINDDNARRSQQMKKKRKLPLALAPPPPPLSPLQLLQQQEQEIDLTVQEEEEESTDKSSAKKKPRRNNNNNSSEEEDATTQQEAAVHLQFQKQVLNGKSSEQDTLLVYPIVQADDAMEIEKDRAAAANGCFSIEGASSNVNAAVPAAVVPAAAVVETNAMSRTDTLTIQVGDYQLLEPQEYLNDTLVDFWMQWIMRNNTNEKGDNNDKSMMHIFSTRFYTDLVEKGIEEAVTEWTTDKKIDIFEKKLLCIPIHKRLQWSMVVVVNPAHIVNMDNVHEDDATTDQQDDVDAQRPASFILLLDSTNNNKAPRRPIAAIAKKIRAWLNTEWTRRLYKNQELQKEEEDPFTTKTLAVFYPTIPFPQDDCDSGLYLCRYAYALFQLRHETFSFGETKLLAQKAKDRIKMLITDSDACNFDENDIQRLRTEIKTILEKLSVDYANLAIAKKSTDDDTAMKHDEKMPAT